MIRTHEIRLTELDAVRLERALMELLKASDGEPQGASELESLLDAAAIVPSASIDPEQSKVSVLSPVGRALLGARVNDRVHVVVPGYGERELALVALTYQPEANGRFDL